MSSSRGAALIYSALAVLFIVGGWLAVFRNSRIDELRERLETLRDAAFDALWRRSDTTSGRATEAGVAWIGTLARHADILTAGRFLLVWLFAGGRGMSGPANAADLGDPYSAEALSIVRRHLVWGCLPLALIPKRVLENEIVLRLIISTRLR
jgi:hypothetical protein